MQSWTKAFFLFLVVIGMSNCDPFAYNHEKINSCAEAISFHNTEDGEYETADQFLNENVYAHLSGAIISFVKDTNDEIRLKIIVEWEKVDMAQFKIDTISPDDVKWHDCHLYIEFRGGAESHISAIYDHDYQVTRGFHVRYISDPIRSEIINQIIELQIKELRVATSGYSTYTDKKVPCKNLSFALECLKEI